MPRSEKHIIEQCIKGDEGAQRELYMRYRVKWYMTCMRYGKTKFEADDIMQDGLIQVYRDLLQFDEKRSKFLTWSSRIFAHTALKHLKKNRWHETFESIEVVSEKSQSNDEDVYEKLATKELIKLIQSLPDGYRIIFNMYALEGYKHKEIAEELGISEGTSKSQLSKAKKELRKMLELQLIETSKR